MIVDMKMCKYDKVRKDIKNASKISFPISMKTQTLIIYILVDHSDVHDVISFSIHEAVLEEKTSVT